MPESILETMLSLIEMNGANVFANLSVELSQIQAQQMQSQKEQHPANSETSAEPL